MRESMYSLLHLKYVRPVAVGVSYNLNPLGLFSTERGKRDLEN